MISLCMQGACSLCTAWKLSTCATHMRQRLQTLACALLAEQPRPTRGRRGTPAAVATAAAAVVVVAAAAAAAAVAVAIVRERSAPGLRCCSLALVVVAGANAVATAVGAFASRRGWTCCCEQRCGGGPHAALARSALAAAAAELRPRWPAAGRAELHGPIAMAGALQPDGSRSSRGAAAAGAAAPPSRALPQHAASAMAWRGCERSGDRSRA
eukprot:351955-Chlamydomonas_euryale.AAC.8